MCGILCTKFNSLSFDDAERIVILLLSVFLFKALNFSSISAIPNSGKFNLNLIIKFFLSFESTGAITNLPIQLEAKVNEYLSLIMRLIFAFGISFQLPVLLNLLAKIGVVNSDYLRKRRKYVVVIIFSKLILA